MFMAEPPTEFLGRQPPQPDSRPGFFLMEGSGCMGRQGGRG